MSVTWFVSCKKKVVKNALVAHQHQVEMISRLTILVVDDWNILCKWILVFYYSSWLRMEKLKLKKKKRKKKIRCCINYIFVLGSNQMNCSFPLFSVFNIRSCYTRRSLCSLHRLKIDPSLCTSKVSSREGIERDMRETSSSGLSWGRMLFFASIGLHFVLGSSSSDLSDFTFRSLDCQISLSVWYIIIGFLVFKFARFMIKLSWTWLFLDFICLITMHEVIFLLAIRIETCRIENLYFSVE